MKNQCDFSINVEVAVVKLNDSSQTKLIPGRGYYEQVKRLMEI